jgi:predicted O-methyltransferase YrrM
VLPTLTNKYDLIFIDGAKGQYPVYLKHAKSLINENGIIIADNILGGGITNHGDGSHGSGKMNHENRPRGLHGVSRRDMTIVKRMKEYIDDIMSDEEYITSIFDIDDGIIVSKKR